jgi:hypothetical protein
MMAPDEEEDRRQPKQLGDGQWQFVKKVRAAIKKDYVGFFNEHDWKHILPATGSYDSNLLNKGNKNTTKVDHFYVKPLACWVPHLLIKNHVPTCPRCESKEICPCSASRLHQQSHCAVRHVHQRVPRHMSLPLRQMLETICWLQQTEHAS